ncbi:MAG: cupin domain-containing protein, partial [Nocardioides sp.]
MTVTDVVEIRGLNRGELTRAYGLESQRLLPWPALNAPFEGAWCVVRPNEESTPHAHHEYEIFIAMTGRASLVVDGERRDFAAGDIAHLPPGCRHQLVNDSPGDFEYYGIWWDTDMSEVFLARHAEGSGPDRGMAREVGSAVSGRGEAALEPSARRADASNKATNDTTLIISPAPTANGDLHLGHLAGPFLAADVHARYLRAIGRDVLLATGFQDTS